ncbi:ribosomal protein L49/IMG2 [Gigaspora margarita]|uniref:Large ribosomal subunit protein mL49 n=1 Tax=Gigaspora margarita TaxID=4874 RepID=A0A8H4B514_GIGMA|nr:ribosomal protein L49/IMG2 [Gigaspora margarita]
MQKGSRLTTLASPIIKYVQYPYYIHRTSNKSLPVYIDIKNGRTRILTILRRIEGDIQALRDDIKKDLFPKDHSIHSKVTINHTNNNVVIKGDYCFVLKKWLMDKGF